jgi:hypothetical protein
MARLIPLASRLLAILCTVGLFLNPSVSLANCSISGTITATYPNDPGFEGLWKYCVDVSWNADQGQGSGLSHASVFLGLEACECICDEGIVEFPSPAGTSTGDPDCTELYNGEYACLGDPAIPEGLNSPAVKFEHDEDPACEAVNIGTGTFCFYSLLPPAPYSSNPEGVGLKTGSGYCLGEITGNSPMCSCVTPTVISTWGHVKALHR